MANTRAVRSQAIRIERPIAFGGGVTQESVQTRPGLRKNESKRYEAASGALNSWLMMDNAHRAAVSLRNTSGPNVMGNAPAPLMASISSGAKSPSGPIQTQMVWGRRAPAGK